MLARALGYREQGVRWLALWWNHSTNIPAYADGLVTNVADGNPAAYTIWRHHPAVAPHLVHVRLGSADEEAADWILLDLDDLTIYTGPKDAVDAFLTRHAPPPVSVSARAAAREASGVAKSLELQRFVWAGDPRSPEDVDAVLACALPAVDALRRWLDEQLAT